PGAEASVPAGHIARDEEQVETIEERIEDAEDLRNAREAEPECDGPRPWYKCVGPGLITGAADDDPSGIGTYSVAGAQFGYALLWLTPLCLPLMIAVQEMCGRVGAVTSTGLAARSEEHTSELQSPYDLVCRLLLEKK